jgi:predicted PurR-regulated permease PerM
MTLSNQDPAYKMPFYAKTALIFISVFALTYTLYIGQHIILPILYATIIAVLLNPVVNFLIGKKINKVVAISLVVVLTFVVLIGMVYVLSAQLARLADTFPQFKEKFNAASKDLVRWISHEFNIRRSTINAWSIETQGEAISNISISDQLMAAGKIIIILTLLPVYLFMILYYKPLLLEFFHKLFRSVHHVAVMDILSSTKTIIQNYLVGLVFEMVIIAILNSAGLLLLGIEYAIILGITGAILNIIPYIGGIFAIALPMIIAFVTKDSLSYPFLVFVIYIFIQFIDNHYIIPKIVASRVQINALVSVIVVLVGGTLWGIPGMFLSIPLTAILKVIFDHIEPLKPWGFLLGNIVPVTSGFRFLKTKQLSFLVTKGGKSAANEG